MMSDSWRELLYPLGFLSSLAFGTRMLIQWLMSESRGKSFVMPAFWKLSLCGNLLLALHAFIQIQYHVCLIQMCNAVISWRNLNLMRLPSRQVSLAAVLSLFAVAISTVTCAFLLQGHFLLENSPEWFRIPATPWQRQSGISVSLFWHLLGFLGLALFSSRFWVQWWCVERHQKSYLGSGFWWTSLIGEGLCLLYFLQINDPVNFLGPAISTIPYIRNLMLIYKERKTAYTTL